MTWQSMSPSDEVEAADWIRERLHPFAQDVGAVVPGGFAAYARIFHPANRSRDWKEEEVRWSEVAAWAGRKVHPEMQFHRITSHALQRLQDDATPWSSEPRLGVLSKSQIRALIAPLAVFTTTPEACWFCLWDGYGYVNGAVTSLAVFKQGSPKAGARRPRRWNLRMPAPKAIGNNPDRKRVRLPNRDYLLFRGSVAEAEGWMDGPNLWWPDDHAWCVASEIDLPYSYVGGSQELIDSILGNPAIEALPATASDGITYDSDKINV
jgi:hypothetical protein